LLFILALVVLLAVLAGLGKSSTPSGATGGGGATSVSAHTTVLLDMPGSGIKRSAKFTAAGAWMIGYSYDCTSFLGGRGNFVVYVYNDDGSLHDIAAN
jgi:hypothetical protein